MDDGAVGSDGEAVEFYGCGAVLLFPLEHDAIPGCGGAKLLDRWGGCAGGGEDLGRGSCGAVVGVQNLDPIGEERWRI